MLGSCLRWIQPGRMPKATGTDNVAAESTVESIENSRERKTDSPDRQASNGVDQAHSDQAEGDQSPRDSIPDAAAKSEPSVVVAAEGKEKASTDEGSETPPEQNNKASEEPFIQQRHWYKTLPISNAARTRSQQLLRESPEIKGVPWSAWQPELDAEHVYIRMPGLISAYQLSSGQHLWTRTLSHEQSLMRPLEPDPMGVGMV